MGNHPATRGQAKFWKSSSSQQNSLTRRNGVVNWLGDRGRKGRLHLERLWGQSALSSVCCGGALAAVTGALTDWEFVEAVTQDRASGWARDGPRRFGVVDVF